MEKLLTNKPLLDYKFNSLSEGKKKVSSYNLALTSSYLFFIHYNFPLLSLLSPLLSLKQPGEIEIITEAGRPSSKISIWPSPILPPH